MDSIMDDKARLHLQKMIKVNNVEDQTNIIRELKHSHILQSEINNLLQIKFKYRNRILDSDDIVNTEGMSKCSFLFTYYTDIYNKIRKDEIDLSILNKFLNVLRRIEDGELDQHEGAFIVGSLLKEIYVDSALRKANKLNAEHDDVKEEPREKLDISWKQYKRAT